MLSGLWCVEIDHSANKSKTWPKAFLATAFLTLGRRRHVVLRCYTLEQHVIRGLGKGRLCMGMAHMLLHLIKNPEV